MKKEVLCMHIRINMEVEEAYEENSELLKYAFSEETNKMYEKFDDKVYLLVNFFVDTATHHLSCKFSAYSFIERGHGPKELIETYLDEAINIESYFYRGLNDNIPLLEHEETTLLNYTSTSASFVKLINAYEEINIQLTRRLTEIADSLWTFNAMDMRFTKQESIAEIKRVY